MREAFCHFKSQNRFPARNAGKLSAMNERVFCNQSLQLERHGYGETAFGCLQPLKPVFYYLKSEFLLNLKLKYQQFNVKRRPIS
jgi:hypothetical protein